MSVSAEETARLWGRAYRLLIDDFELKASPKVEGLRLSFEVDRDLQATANQGKVKIWNLSPEHRAVLNSGKRAVLLEAGYQDHLGAVLSFDKVTVSHGREDLDWVTVLEGGDGQGALGTPVDLSVGPGATSLEVVQKAARKAGLGVDQLLKAVGEGDVKSAAEALRGVVYDGGRVLFGGAGSIISEEALAAGAKIHVQDGELEAHGDADVTPGTTVFVSPTRGLIGFPVLFTRPEHPKREIVRFQTLLLPGLNPGRAVELDSADASGRFRVDKVRHEGDTHGADGAWISTIEARRIS